MKIENIGSKIISSSDPSFSKLFDSDTTSAWFPGWKPESYPAWGIIDLNQSVTKLRYFDGTGIPHINIYQSKDLSNFSLVKNLELNLYQAWVQVPVSITERYVKIELLDIQGDMVISELEFYDGINDPVDPVENPPVIPPPIPPQPPVIPLNLSGDALKIGCNTYPWIPLELMLPLQRLYIASGWIWQPAGLYIEPMFQAGKPYMLGLDSYLQKAKELGKETMFCINQTPEWYRPTGRDDGNNDYPPIKPGLNRLDPNSYKDYADFLFQVVARYGNVVHPLSSLKVDTSERWGAKNELKTGLKLLKYIEVGNEYDRWWKLNSSESEQYLTPEESAALFSICYKRIKEADPSMGVVMAGLTGFDWPYFDRFYKAVMKLVPNAKFIINLHHYSNKGNKLGTWPPTWYPGQGINPELDEDFIGIKQFVDFAKQQGLKCFVSEFGYDTILNPQNPSWQYPLLQEGQNSEEVQANWLVRTFLEYIRLGVDKLYLYLSNDLNVSGGLYTSSGILRTEGQGFAPKMSHYQLNVLVKELNGFTFYKDVSVRGIKIYEFKSSKGASKYIYWTPDDKERRMSFKRKNIVATSTPKYLIPSLLRLDSSVSTTTSTTTNTI